MTDVLLNFGTKKVVIEVSKRDMVYVLRYSQVKRQCKTWTLKTRERDKEAFVTKTHMGKVR